MQETALILVSNFEQPNFWDRILRMRIPKEVLEIGKSLAADGYKAYLVGGCLRDLLLKREPKDWDIATDARPEEVQKLFPDSVYENKFGTVLVKVKARTSADFAQANAEGTILRNSASSLRESALNVVEVTTFRIEGKYTDKRHPDEIKFAKTIEEDLSRRDFTINALAISIGSLNSIGLFDDRNVVDPFGGKDDLKNKIIRTVGNAEERFSEDALRLMRAVRFSVELGFEIELNTRRAIEKKAGLLEMIAKERIRDEFEKIIMTPDAARGVILLEELGLLRYVLPELRSGLGVTQNLHHIYTVFEHNIRSLDYAAKKNYPFHIRLAALLHDIGKPKTKRGEGPNSTFYGHEIVGAKMAVAALDRLKFPRDFTEKVAHLIRYHMFYYNVGEVTAAGVRRFLARVGPENVDDFIKVREADRIGSGVPKAVPYKIRHLLFMIEKVKCDPISPKMLKVDGNDVMEILKIGPGPKVGRVLSILLEEVLDDPQKNNEEYLVSRIKYLGNLSDNDLKKFAERAKKVKNEFEEGLEEEMKRKYRV